MEVTEVITRQGGNLTLTRTIKFGSNGLEQSVMFQLGRIEAQQKSILEVLMTNRADFDAALANLLSAEAARDAVVTTALNDLIAKVTAGTLPPEDFAAELQTVQTLASNAAALTQTATVDDPGPTTVPTTPIPPTDGSGGAGDGSAGSAGSASVQ